MAVKKCRSLKVYEQSGYNYKPTPSIHLQGQWLKEIGFESGKYIQVKCEEGKLIITLDEAREKLVDAETEFMESEGAQLDMWYQQEKEKRFAQFVAERKVRYGA